MKIYSKTDIGMVRTANQDAFFAESIDYETAFAVVCDGMGGANAGNVASENAVKSISGYIERSYNGAFGTEGIEKMLKNAIVSANIELYDMAVSNPLFSGMGTTVVLAFVKGETAVIAHAGDSRIYLVNDGIKQLTRDHSVVQSLIESGKITPDDAKVHPKKNVITRAVGAEENIAVDTAVLKVGEGDTLLLCTDGLTNYLDDKDILDSVKTVRPSEIPDTLVDRANKNGGGDNITVVVLTR